MVHIKLQYVCDKNNPNENLLYSNKRATDDDPYHDDILAMPSGLIMTQSEIIGTVTMWMDDYITMYRKSDKEQWMQRETLLVDISITNATSITTITIKKY